MWSFVQPQTAITIEQFEREYESDEYHNLLNASFFRNNYTGGKRYIPHKQVEWAKSIIEIDMILQVQEGTLPKKSLDSFRDLWRD